MDDRTYQTATMRGGLRRNLGRYVDRVTGGGGLGRFLWQGAVLTALSPMPTVAGSVLRSWAYRTVLGAVGRRLFHRAGRPAAGPAAHLPGPARHDRRGLFP